MKKLILALIFLSVNVLAGDVSSYLSGKYQSADKVKENLKAEGFSVVGEYDSMGESAFHVIVFTNPAMKKAASEESRGFAGVQKVLLDEKTQTLVFTNPEYFLHAYLQKDYDEAMGQKITASLQKAFGKMEGSQCSLDDDDIAGYHYMFGLPYYDDMVEIAEGKDLGKILEAKAKDSIVFKLELDNSTIYGISMNSPEGEKSFVPAIDAQDHASFLPYMVMIEDNKAKILHGKYALSIANPSLSMGQFMKIASTPGDIEDYMKELVTK